MQPAMQQPLTQVAMQPRLEPGHGAHAKRDGRLTGVVHSSTKDPQPSPLPCSRHVRKLVFSQGLGWGCRQKEKRLQDEKLRSVKGLGEPDESEDLMAWVHKSRQLEEERAKAERMAKMLQQQVCSCFGTVFYRVESAFSYLSSSYIYLPLHVLPALSPKQPVMASCNIHCASLHS